MAIFSFFINFFLTLISLCLFPINAHAGELDIFDEQKTITTNNESQELSLKAENEIKPDPQSDIYTSEKWFLLGLGPFEGTTIWGGRKNNFGFELFFLPGNIIYESDQQETNPLFPYSWHKAHKFPDNKDKLVPIDYKHNKTYTIHNKTYTIFNTEWELHGFGFNLIYYLKIAPKHSLGLKIGLKYLNETKFIAYSYNSPELLNYTRVQYYPEQEIVLALIHEDKKSIALSYGINYHYRFKDKLSFVMSLQNFGNILIGFSVSR